MAGFPRISGCSNVKVIACTVSLPFDYDWPHANYLSNDSNSEQASWLASLHKWGGGGGGNCERYTKETRSYLRGQGEGRDKQDYWPYLIPVDGYFAKIVVSHPSSGQSLQSL